jgi:hypothetical protein
MSAGLLCRNHNFTHDTDPPPRTFHRPFQRKPAKTSISFRWSSILHGRTHYPLYRSQYTRISRRRRLHTNKSSTWYKYAGSREKQLSPRIPVSPGRRLFHPIILHFNFRIIHNRRDCGRWHKTQPINLLLEKISTLC